TRGAARGRNVDATRATPPSDQLPIAMRSDGPSPLPWLSECCRHATESPDASKYQGRRGRIAVHSRDTSKVPGCWRFGCTSTKRCKAEAFLPTAPVLANERCGAIHLDHGEPSTGGHRVSPSCCSIDGVHTCQRV